MATIYRVEVRMTGKKSNLGTLLYTGVSASTDTDDGRQFTVIDPTDEQQRAIEKVKGWLERVADHEDGLVFVLGGYAGTGKTAVTGILAKDMVRERRVAFAAPTGMAAAVLRRSLAARGVFPDYCGTIHRLLYRPLQDEATGHVIGWEKKDRLEYDNLVIDEASMLSSEVLDDLVSYRLPILAVGDHGQLPPVGEDVNLMARPNARLEEVHRQALDNPVVAFSVAVRQGADWRAIVRASTDPRLAHVDSFDSTALVMDRFKGFQNRPPTDDPLVICGMNKSRKMLNAAARAGLGPDLVVGDRVTCLRNQYLSDKLLANGFRGVVRKLGTTRNAHQTVADVNFPDESLDLVDGRLCRQQFGAEKTISKFTEVDGCRSWEEAGLLFDYGNALTCHRAQGQQRRSVIVLVEDFASTAEEFRRWLYTAASRAVYDLTVMFSN
jgi:exodeoxyribonuclease V